MSSRVGLLVLAVNCLLSGAIPFVIDCSKEGAKHCDFPTEGAGATEAEDTLSEMEQMAYLADAAYNKDVQRVTGWDRVFTLDLAGWSKDIFALFALPARQKCVISAAGTNSPFDFLENFDARLSDLCGFTGVHNGYVSEVEDLWKNENFTSEWWPYLKGDNCSGGVTIVGHSLGGGVASLLAGCANNGSRPYGFVVDKLFTYGAPAVSTTSITNGETSQSDCGCFAGARIWNRDGIYADPIPRLSRSVSLMISFRHPHIIAIELDNSDNATISITLACNSNDAEESPGFTSGISKPSLHDNRVYNTRIGHIFTNGSGISSGNGSITFNNSCEIESAAISKSSTTCTCALVLLCFVALFV